MQLPVRLCVLAAISLTGSCYTFALAAQTASDSAGDSVYNGGFTQGSNGGYGWDGGWLITTPPFAGLGDSTTNGPGDPYAVGDINSPRVAGGRAWALNGDNEATRSFAGPLSVGQTFSVDYDNGFLFFDFPHTWMTLDAVGGSGGIRFGYLTQNFTYEIDGSTIIDTHIPISYNGLHLAVTRLQASYQIAVMPYASGATSGSFVVPFDQPIDAVTFHIDGAGTSNVHDTLYFNNIQITPEPGVASLLVISASAMLMRRRAS